MTTIYPHKCSICKSPAIGLICSNVKCKSWGKYRRMAVGKKIIEAGLTSDDPIIVYCPRCLRLVINLNAPNKVACSCRAGWLDNTIPYQNNMWYAIDGKDNAYLIVKYVNGYWANTIRRAINNGNHV